MCPVFLEQQERGIPMYFARLRKVVPSVVIASLTLVSLLTLSLVSSPAYASASKHGSYQQTNLVSDQAGQAQFTDANLVNAWGIAYGPTSPFWISDNHTGVSTLYNGKGQPFPMASPLVVTIPLPKGGSGAAAPTGVVFNGTNDFVVRQNGHAGPSRFIFDTEDGTISGWSPSVNMTKAIRTVDNSASGTVYKGLAIGNHDGRDLIFATDFHGGKVDVYDSNFKWVKAFSDPDVPKGYASFGIQNIGGWLYVTFARQDAAKHDDAHGPHRGFVDIFRTDGHLVKRLISRGVLNSPWGLALAPSDFGSFSNALLVGNFGDGLIHAFDPHNGHFLGTLRDKDEKPIVIDGLWALTFGNGTLAGQKNELFFTAGPNEESHGLFGVITVE